MRFLLVLVLSMLPTWAFAKPTLALVPIEGDKDGKVAELIIEASSDDHDVVDPGKVESTMAKLEIAELDGKAVRKLRKRLAAEILVYGKVDKDGKQKTLTLSVSARGKRTAKIEIEYKSADAKSFKRELRAELGRKLASAERDESNDDDADEDGDKPKRTASREDRDEDGESRVRKKNRDEDEEDGDGKRRKKKPKRHKVTHAALRIGGGGAAARRTLTWDASGANIPPSVGTFGAAGRIDIEAYPLAFDTLKGAAGLGLYGEFEKTFGVGIEVPGTTVTSAIDQSRYSIGARYRIPFGTSSFAFGVSYWSRRYIADRAMADLDTPDVTYKAVAPTGVLRFALSPTMGAYASAEVPLMLSTGGIQRNSSYGPSNVIAFDLEAGAEILIGTQYGIRLAAQFEQVAMSFEGKAGSQSQVRMVTSATDRLVGATATLTIVY